MKGKRLFFPSHFLFPPSFFVFFFPSSSSCAPCHEFRSTLKSCMRSVLLFAWLASSFVLLLKGRAWLVRRAAAAAGLRASGLPTHAPALLRSFPRRLRGFFATKRNAKRPERPSHLDAVLQRSAAAGGDYGVLLGDRAVVHCVRPALARAALAAAGPSKAPLYAAFAGFVGTALFTAEGEAWCVFCGFQSQFPLCFGGCAPSPSARRRAERAAVTKALAAPSIASIEAVARTAAATAVEAILRDAARSASNGGNGVVNLMPHFQRLTLRATIALLSGGGCPAPSDSAADAYLASAAALRACLPAKARDFWFNVLPAWAHARLTPAGRAEARAIRSAHLLAEQCVRHAAPGSPLWLLLGADACGGGKDRAAVSSGDRNSPGFPPENWAISGVLKPFCVPLDAVRRAQTLLFAGHDTQAATLCWAAVRMGLEEDGGVGVQARLRAACAAASASSTSSVAAAAAAVTAATARGACCCGGVAGAAHTPAASCSGVPCDPPSPFPSLLEAVLKETLRLHPPAPLVLRPLRHALPIPAPLPGEGASSPPQPGAKPTQITIPKQRAQSPPSRRRHAPAGAAAAVWLHAAQRDPHAWAPDPHSFRPDRWLQQPPASSLAPPADPNSALNSGGKKSADGEAFGVSCSDAQRHAYLPFAAGARACPGGAVALASLRPALAEVVARVKWECCDKFGGGIVPCGEQEGGVLRPSDGFTVTPMHGVWARVRPS